MEPSPDLARGRALEAAPTFVFNHDLLLRLVQRLPEDLAVVEFYYTAETRLLSFRTPAELDDVPKHFRFKCLQHTEFFHDRAQIGPDPTILGKINPIILRRAVSYVNLFARQDETQHNLDLIELRAGELVGGTLTQMGRFTSTTLEGVDMKIQFKFVKALEALLALLNPDDTTVLETEQALILTDGQLVFGFARYSFEFPNVTRMYTFTSDNHVLVPRGQLHTTLTLLEALNKSGTISVEFLVTGESADARLQLRAQEPGKELCSAVLEVARRSNPGLTSKFEAWHFAVPLRLLWKLVGQFESTNVQLEVYHNALYVYDEPQEQQLNAGPDVAQSLLYFMTPAGAGRRRPAAAGLRSIKKHTLFVGEILRNSNVRAILNESLVWSYLYLQG